MGYTINHVRGVGVIKIKQIRSRCLAQKLTEIMPSNCWAGETCFIVGGGPSLKGFDWKQLNGYRTIGINKAFQHYPVQVNYAMDYNFFDMVQYNVKPDQPHYELHQDWMKYQGIKVFLRHDSAYVFTEGICYIDELVSKQICFNLDYGLYGGNNSGMGGLMLALAFGCKRIGLLGFDLKMVADQTHFHEGYVKQNKTQFANNLEIFRKCIDELGPAILQLGIDVVNLSPISTLQSFPKSDIGTFIQAGS